jgi:hypothetical protein
VALAFFAWPSWTRTPLVLKDESCSFPPPWDSGSAPDTFDHPPELQVPSPTRLCSHKGSRTAKRASFHAAFFAFFFFQHFKEKQKKVPGILLLTPPRNRKDKSIFLSFQGA